MPCRSAAVEGAGYPAGSQGRAKRRGCKSSNAATIATKGTVATQAHRPNSALREGLSNWDGPRLLYERRESGVAGFAEMGSAEQHRRDDPAPVPIYFVPDRA